MSGNTKELEVQDITHLGYPPPEDLSGLSNFPTRLTNLENQENAAAIAAIDAAGQANSHLQSAIAIDQAITLKNQATADLAADVAAKKLAIDAIKNDVENLKTDAQLMAQNAAAAAVLSDSFAEAANNANISGQAAKNASQAAAAQAEAFKNDASGILTQAIDAKDLAVAAKNNAAGHEANAAANATTAVAAKNDATGILAQAIDAKDLALNYQNAAQSSAAQAGQAHADMLLIKDDVATGLSAQAAQLNSLNVQINGGGGITSRIIVTEGQVANLTANKADLSYLNSQIASVNDAVSGKVAQSTYDNFVSLQSGVNTSQATSVNNLTAKTTQGEFETLNGGMDIYPTATGAPTNWGQWNSSNNAAYVRVSDGNGGYACQVAGGAGIELGLAQTIPDVFKVGDYGVLQATFRLDAGTLTGAGIWLDYLPTISTGLIFASELDAYGNKLIDNNGLGTVGKTYTVSKLVKIASSNASQMYGMTHWSLCGSVANANQITWFKLGIRKATQAEIQANKALNDPLGTGQSLAAAITNEQIARANGDSALSASITTLSASLNNEATQNLLLNGLWSRGGSDWTYNANHSYVGTEGGSLLKGIYTQANAVDVFDDYVFTDFDIANWKTETFAVQYYLYFSGGAAQGNLIAPYIEKYNGTSWSYHQGLTWPNEGGALTLYKQQVTVPSGYTKLRLVFLVRKASGAPLTGYWIGACMVSPWRGAYPPFSEGEAFSAIHSNVTQNAQAIANANATFAAFETQTNSSLNGLNTSVTAAQSSINGILGKASVLIDANGKITGWQAIGGGAISDFIIYANKFKFEDGTNAFSIDGGTVYMNNAKIKNLIADNIATNAITQSSQSALGSAVAINSSWVDLQTLAVTNENCNTEIVVSGVVSVTSNTNTGAGEIVIRVLRDTTEIYPETTIVAANSPIEPNQTLDFDVGNSITNYQFINLTFGEVPPAGTANYKIQAKRYGGLAGNGERGFIRVTKLRR